MDTQDFKGKLKRLPAWVVILTIVIFGGLVGLTIFEPFWPKFVFFLVVLGLFCPHFNILGGSCGATFWTYVFGWTVIAIGLAILILMLKKLWTAWKNL